MGEEEGPEVDALLRGLVDAVNGTSIKIGVTLLVRGSLVSGRLVGGNIFFDRVAEDFGSKLPPDAKDGVERAIRMWGLDYGRASEEAADENQEREIAFFHLEDARVYDSGGRIPENGTWLRGRLSSVDAWSFGSLFVEH